MMNCGSCGFYAPFSLDGLASVGMFRIFVRMNLNSNLMWVLNKTDKNGCRCGIVIVGINKIISSINNTIYAEAGNLIKGIAIC